MNLPTPHGDKLNALLHNEKIPEGDHERIKQAIKRYKRWVKSLGRVPKGDDCVSKAISLLNEYRMYLDLEVVFDSRDDFLYRQKGQLKLDNTVIEEFFTSPCLSRIPTDPEGFLHRDSPLFRRNLFHFDNRNSWRNAGSASSTEGPGLHNLKETVSQSFIPSRRFWGYGPLGGQPGLSLR